MRENIARLSPFGSVLLAFVLFVPLGGKKVVAGQESRPSHARYAVKDLGTFGGPSSFYFSEPVVESANNRGMVVGGADTSVPDPFAPNCLSRDCSILHAFQWRNGVLTDLGTLTGSFSSVAFWVNDRGLVLGLSETGGVDPLTGIPEQVAVVWKDRQIVNLGTLEGGVFSFPNAMNNRGYVTGVAQNTIPDPFSLLGLGTQSRAFLWHGGALEDLGTLGGPDGWGASVNEHVQVAGFAYTNYTPNPMTNIPTLHPFLWEDHAMQDLGTLGGTLAVVGSLQSPGAGASINNRGQVIGTSNLAGDLINHPFRWTKGDGMKDLGTLGGDNGEAWWINDAGEIVGGADIDGSTTHHAFLWRNGVMTDLGVPHGQNCSTAIDVNAKSQIIIDTGICGVSGGPGLLWENGVAYDLNTLIPPDSGFFIGDVNFINDRGEIAVTGVLPSGDQHDLVLVPCERDQADTEGCDDVLGRTNPTIPKNAVVNVKGFRYALESQPNSHVSKLLAQFGHQPRAGGRLRK